MPSDSSEDFSRKQFIFAADSQAWQSLPHICSQASSHTCHTVSHLWCMGNTWLPWYPFIPFEDHKSHKLCIHYLAYCNMSKQVFARMDLNIFSCVGSSKTYLITNRQTDIYLPMTPYRFIWILMSSCDSLWVPMAPYVFLWLPTSSYSSLWVPMAPY